MNKKRYIFRKNTGITIIALIVTIIVLSIIAGVTITYMSSGAIGEAQQLKSEAQRQNEIEIIRQRLSEIYAEKEGDYLVLADVVDVVKTLDGHEIEKSEVINPDDVELNAGYEYFLKAEGQEFLIDEIGGKIGGYSIKSDLNTIIARRLKYQMLGMINILGKFTLILNDTGAGTGTIGLSYKVNEGMFDVLRESSILSSLTDDAIEDAGIDVSTASNLEYTFQHTLQYSGIAGEKISFSLPDTLTTQVHMTIQGLADLYSGYVGHVDTDDLLEEIDLTQPITIDFYRINQNGLMLQGDNSEPINHFMSMEISSGFLGKKAMLSAEIDRSTGEVNTAGLCAVTEDKNRYGEPHPIGSFISSLTTPSDSSKGWGYKTNNDKAIFFSDIEGTSKAADFADKIRDLIDPIIETINELGSEGESPFTINPVFFDKLTEYMENVIQKSKLYIAYSGIYNGSTMEVDKSKMGSTMLYLYFKGSPKIYINLYELAELTVDEIGVNDNDISYTNKNINVYTLDWARLQESIYDKNDEYMDLSLKVAVKSINGENPNYSDTTSDISQEDLAILANSPDMYSSTRIFTQGSVNELVRAGDTIVISCKVYNEALSTKGGTAATAKVIAAYLPEGLEFDENNETNVQYGWTEESEGVLKTSYTADKVLEPFNPVKDENDNYIIDYEEIELVLKVIDSATNETKFETPFEIFDSEGPNGLQDIDSTPGNYLLAMANQIEDDNSHILLKLRTETTGNTGSLIGDIAEAIFAGLLDALSGVVNVFCNLMASFMDGGIKTFTIFFSTYPKTYTLVTMSQAL